MIEEEEFGYINISYSYKTDSLNISWGNKEWVK